MGKRVKKKNNRAPQKDKRVVGHSPKIVPEKSTPNVHSVDDGGTGPRERKLCAHVEKGFDLDKLAGKIGSSGSCRCEDCREGVADRRGAKGKDKQGKKKGGSSVDLKSESKAIWICLECGHYACGGVGLPTTPHSHAVRHARATHHPVVVQWENPHLRWCFQCNILFPVEKTEEDGEKKDALLSVVKLIKAHSSERSAADVEEVWLGGGSKAEGTVSSSLEGRGGYSVRGLVNLGNTCFFNSVTQNLLAMDKLRSYFFNEDASFGTLSISLKKLYAETKVETGLKNVINPRSFFGSICSKAPQFKGYQQQDSHELLRCLLDGLSTEELAVRKQINASKEDGISQRDTPTFVDAAFGGRVSNTVRCVECGHTSTVYEPFLDLSLPVPTKKPPTKNVQPLSRAKKTKLPPKRGGRIRPKGNKNVDTVPAQSISYPSGSAGSSDHKEPSAVPNGNMVASSCDTPLPDSIESISYPSGSDGSPDHKEPSVVPNGNMVASSCDTPLPDSIGPSTSSDVTDLVSQNFSAVPGSESEKIGDSIMNKRAASFDDLWLDYIGPETKPEESDCTSRNNDISLSECSGDKIMVHSDDLKAIFQVNSVDGEPNLKLDSSSVNPWEEEVLLQVQSSEVLLLPYKEENTESEIFKGESEASSSVVGNGQDEGYFDGFGDLFNEPDVSPEPVAGPSLRSGFMAGNIESEPDEVDNTDSPVSVESCLAHFIKPEHLCDDNAWECENCSKALLRQRLEAKKKQAKTASEALVNRDKKQTQSDITSLGKGISWPIEPGNLCNGDANTPKYLNSIGENLVSDNEKVDCSDQNRTKAENGQTDELKQFIPQPEEQEAEMNAFLEQSHASTVYESYIGGSLSGPTVDSSNIDVHSSTGYTTAKDQLGDSQSSGNCESEADEDDDKTSKKVNVKRDASKWVLIDKGPPILTIHLKRFSQDARGRLSKLNGHVNFRDVLDLRPYMDPRCADMDKNVYRLLGVVEHSGTMRGGHYVAYVRGKRNRGKAEKENGGSVWYHVSDVYVREVSLEEVLRCEAYILFYEKIFD